MTSKPNRCYLKGVVYKIVCNICGKIYIGETGRSIGTRIKEHLYKKSYSAVQAHFDEEHCGLQPAFNINWEILHTGLSHFNRRKTLEGMYISKEEPYTLMNGCTGRSIVYES